MSSQWELLNTFGLLEMDNPLGKDELPTSKLLGVTF